MPKYYTKTGDDGTTSLYGGTRVKKSSERVQAFGDVDELNSFLGLCLTEVKREDLKETIERVQDDLFTLGSEVSAPETQKPKVKITRERVEFLEEKTNQLSSELPTPTKFVLPSGVKAAALVHVARTIARRSERSVLRVKSSAEVVKYLNRLSSLLYVIALTINKDAEYAEKNPTYKT